MYNTIHPAYVRPYGIGVNNRQIVKKTDDEEKKSSQSSEKNAQNDNTPSRGNNYFPTGEKVAIDYTQRRINIEQVLTDFKNTANAIGAPDDIKSEVSSYLSLVYSQAQKDRPNQSIIQSNLKNASQILDEYITNTLKKPSKVVENWVDALFLQHIDYKVQKNEAPNNIEQELKQQEINLPESNEKEQPSLIGQEAIYIPQDPQLKRMFIQAKKYAAINNQDKALDAFQNTMDYAQSIGEGEAYAIAQFEKGLIYDKKDDLESALYNYHNAAKQTANNNVKAKAYMNMGKIYDDFVKFEPAFNHYCAAVSFAGEADNLKLQTQALSNLAKIHSERYDKENTYKFIELSDIISEETSDDKVIGIIASKNAKNCQRVSDDGLALKYYAKSAKSFSDIDDNVNLAKKYLEAAEIMLKYGNKAKAKRLLSKAFVAASSTFDIDLKQQITSKIANL